MAARLVALAKGITTETQLEALLVKTQAELRPEVERLLRGLTGLERKTRIYG